MFKFRSFVLHLSDRKIRPASKTGAPARAVGRVGGHVQRRGCEPLQAVGPNQPRVDSQRQSTEFEISSGIAFIHDGSATP